MKITFLSPPLNMTGGTKVIAIYADYLLKNGHEVLVVSTPRGQHKLFHQLKNLIKGKPFQLIKRPVKHSSHFDGSLVKQHVINEKRPIMDADLPDADVVIATWWETAEWANQLSPTKGAKVYFIQHYEVFEYLPIVRCKATYKMPLHKIVIAQWLLKIMQQEYGDTQVDLVSNSVDKNQFFAPIRVKQNIPTIGFLFANATFKGVDITLQAIAMIKKTLPNVRVISFGVHVPKNVPFWDNSIEFYCAPDQDKIRDIYAQCDVWMTASRSEGFNLPAMEAMACKTPIVSTMAGWPMEAILSHQNGVLTEIDDIQALADGAKWVLNLSKDDWMALSLSAFNTVADSSWEKSGLLFEQALKNAISIHHDNDLKSKQYSNNSQYVNNS